MMKRNPGAGNRMSTLRGLCIKDARSLEDNNYFNRIAIGIVILLGFVLRIIGYDWGGERTIYQPDEYNVVHPIMEMVENQSFVNDNWTYPSRCTSQVIVAFLNVYTRINIIDWIDYYYIVRFFYVLFSTIVILLSYILIKKCCNNKNLALFFSFLIALNPIYIKYSKQAVGDTPVMMFWLVVGILMLDYLKSERCQYLLYMSFFAACATLEKWNGIGITILIAIGVIYRNRREIGQLFLHGCISFISWGLFIFLLAPNVITEGNNIVASMNAANPSLGSSLIQGHLEFFFAYVGLEAILLCIIGLYSMLIAETNSGNGVCDNKFIPLSLAIIGLLEDWLLCEQLVERHGLMVFWGCTFLIALGTFYFVKKGNAFRKAAILLMAIVIISWFAQSVLVDAVAVRSKNHDTRQVALSYLNSIEATVDNSTGEEYTPFNPPYADSTMEVCDINELLYLDNDNQPCIAIPEKKYIILSEYSYEDRSSDGYRILREKGNLIKRFEGAYDADLFLFATSPGKWWNFGLDIIRNTFDAIVTVCNSDMIGPWIEVYDVSEFAAEDCSEYGIYPE